MDFATFVADLYPGPISSEPNAFVSLGGQVLFTAETPPLTGDDSSSTTTRHDAWISDGNATYVLQELTADGLRFVSPNDKHALLHEQVLFFGASQRLWRSEAPFVDATSVATLDDDPTQLVLFRDTLYFATGSLLWRYDSKTANQPPVLAYDLGVDVLFARIEVVANLNDDYLIIGSDFDGLWSYSEGENATAIYLGGVVDLPTYASVVTLNDKLYFAGRDTADIERFGLWATNGTALERIFYADDYTPRSVAPVIVNDKVVFFMTISNFITVIGTIPYGGDFRTVEALNVTFDDNGPEADVWDGTLDLYVDVPRYGRLYAFYSLTGSLGKLGNELILVNRHPFFNPDFTSLWTTNGTSQGTRLVFKFPNAGYLSDVNFIGETYTVFRLNGPSVINEIWLTDGSRQGTVLVANLTGTESINTGSSMALLYTSELLVSNEDPLGSDTGVELIKVALPLPLTTDPSATPSVAPTVVTPSPTVSTIISPNPTSMPTLGSAASYLSMHARVGLLVGITILQLV